jgi:aryl-alcohol dehydrogenase-like predicted oxidoreductase
VFDTAWYYGPNVASQLLADAVRSYPADLVIATKLGWAYDDRGQLVAAPAPAELRAGLERDLLLLGTDAISIVHLRWGQDRSVSESFRRALAAMIQMRQAGWFRHIGLSNVGLAQLQYALERTEIASVSNSYSLADQADSDVVDFTTRRDIPYLPWLPLRRGSAEQIRTVGAWAQRLHASPAQVALAWLLGRASNILPIPGTSTVGHLEENQLALKTLLPPAAMRDLRSRETYDSDSRA